MREAEVVPFTPPEFQRTFLFTIFRLTSFNVKPGPASQTNETPGDPWLSEIRQ